jgi:hypothetical protein
MIRLVRQYLAKRKLDKLVRRNRESYEIQDYRKRRAAALKARGV